jgi:hypothetical protein
VCDGDANGFAVAWPAASIADIKAATDAPMISLDREIPAFRRTWHSYDRPVIRPQICGITS